MTTSGDSLVDDGAVDERPEVLIGAAELARRVEELAAEVAARLPEPFTLVALMKGALVLAADLLRALDHAGRRPRLKLLQLASYGAHTTSAGEVRLVGAMPEVAGAHLLLVDDIQDTGRTLAAACELLRQAGAASTTTLVLLDKPTRRLVGGTPDLVGFEIPDLFVVGYGIDHAERWRHLPFIGQAPGT